MATHDDSYRATVDDEAYEPTYTEAFPPLPSSASSGESDGDVYDSWQSRNNSWNQDNVNMAVRSSIVTQAYVVPVEERRFKEFSEAQFGEKDRIQARICSDIMSRTGVSIEMSLARDLSLTVVITGKQDAVLQARKFIVQQLQTQASSTIKIPKDHHRYLLGTQGKNLAKLELQTLTKISIPRQEENSDVVTITGTREGIDKARHEIQLISDEQAKLALVRLNIPKIYHTFILGPNGQTVKELSERTGARINIPPMSVAKDEIVIAGEKEGVHTAEAEITKIYEAKKRSCKSVSVDIRKSQHKYVIGSRGSHVNEILAETGVSVEVPPLDSPLEAITLRGDADKLGLALTAVYAKANSVTIQELEVPQWLHRFIIGPKGASIKEINQEFPKVHIEFYDNKVVLEGPPDEVEKAEEAINSKAKDLTSRMAFVDLKVESKHHKNIRQSRGVARIKKESGVSIRIPPEDSNSNIVRIEGTPEGVARAKMELIEIVEKMENEKVRDIIIDRHLHKVLIGAHGNSIRDISAKFGQVQITFPEAAKQSDVVVLRGPKNDVDQCHKFLQLTAQDLAVKNYRIEMHVTKETYKNLTARGGAKIKKICDETETRIEMVKSNGENDLLSITGRKENVEKAKKTIDDMERELANYLELAVEIPQKFHVLLIGPKGQLVRSVQEECGGVEISFPHENKASDVVMVRGGRENVEKAKQQLLELANEKKEANFTAELRVKPEYHGFLIGRGGTTINKFRERGVRILFPAPKDQNPEIVTIVGKREAVEKAKAELEKQIADLENVVELEVNIDSKHHSYFVQRRSEVANKISEDYGGVVITFPRIISQSSLVVLRGAKDCTEAAKTRMLEIVQELESRVTIDCVIPQKFHRNILGAKGRNIREITAGHDVQIKFPDRIINEEHKVMNGHHNSAGEDGASNGERSPVDEKSLNTADRDTIRITGHAENCQAAKEAMMAFVPVTVEMSIPSDFHGQIIGQKGAAIRQLMDAHDVSIFVPPSSEKSDVIRITGSPGNIESARRALETRVSQLEEDRTQKELRSFKSEVEVDARHHFTLIGKRGAVVNKIQKEYDVKVQFPDRDSKRPNTIIITGQEKAVHDAQEEILKRVQELEERTSEEIVIDPRVHPRIIGAKGRSVNRLMEEFGVDIKFPGRDAKEKDVVTITGMENNVLDCRDHLLNLAEEYMQDVVDGEVLDQRRSPSWNRHHDDDNKAKKSNQPSKGFIVHGAPWSTPSASDFTNDDANDFPSLTPSSTSSAQSTSVSAAWKGKSGKP